VNGLVNGSPVMSNIQVNDFTDRILSPRPKQDMSAPPAGPESEPEPRAAWEEMYGWQESPTSPPQQEGSRARAIFDASDEAQPFNPSGFDFETAEQEAHAEEIPPVPREPEAESPARPSKPGQQLMLGFTPFQIAILAGLALLLICILAVFAYVVFT
jgi:hypothetical protein